MDQTKRWSFVAGEEDIISVRPPAPASDENDTEEGVVRCYAPDGTVWATIPLEQPGVREVSSDTIEGRRC
jgi:hypothetical protein